MSEQSRERSQNRRDFLLGFFLDQKENKNEAKEINEFILFKHWDGNIKNWTVHIFSKESFKAMMNRQSRPIQKEKLF